MKKAIIIKYLLLILSFSFLEINLTKGQGIGGSIGYSLNNYFLFDIAFETRNNIIIKFDAGIDTDRNLKGVYYSVIGWNEFPEDVYEEGSFTNNINFEIGYRYKFLFALGIIGFSSDIYYKNCFDNTYILSNNGKYYLTKNGGIYFNPGIELGAMIHFFTISLKFANSGLGLKFGAMYYF